MQPNKRYLWGIFFYFAVLTLLIGLGSGLAGIPVAFLLKEKLKLSSSQFAFFGILTAIPAYVGFFLGMVRDRIRPKGWGDRAYMLLMPLVMASTFFTLSFFQITYTALLIVLLINGFAGTLLGAAFNGLTTSVAQRYFLTGRMSSLAFFIGMFPSIGSALLGGFLTDKVPITIIFRLCAGLFVLTALAALWRPQIIFESSHTETAPKEHPKLKDSIRQLMQHRPLWPAAILQILWLLMPGWGTPLFFYMTNTVKLKPDQIGVVNSIGPIVMLAMSALYGAICHRFPLRRLLFVGVALAIFGTPLAMLIKDFQTAILVNLVAVAAFGIANCAMSDLLMRSYPKGLEGTGATLLGAVGAAAGSGSNLFGSWLYDKSGFGMAMLVSTLCTAAMLPVLFFVPKAVIATREGEAQAAATELPENLPDMA